MGERYSYTLEGANQTQYKVRVLFNIPDNELKIELLKENQVLDSLFFEDVVDLKQTDINVEKDKFLRVPYKVRGGSGVRFTYTLFLSVSSKEKLTNSLFLLSEYTYDLDDYWDKDAPPIDEHQEYILKFQIIDHPFVLIVTESNRIREFKKVHTEKKIHQLNYDEQEGVFYSTKTQDGTFFIEFMEKTYKYQNRMWFRESTNGGYIKME